MGLKGFIAKIILRGFAKKLDLQEGTPMENKKPWYKSKAVWTGIIITLISLYEGVDANVGPTLGFNLPDIPNIVYTILGALGIYSRVIATKKIK